MGGIIEHPNFYPGNYQISKHSLPGKEQPLPQPEGIPLAQAPAKTAEIAQEMLSSLSEAEEGAGWKDARIAPVAYPIYNPAMNKACSAYMEFKVIGQEKQDDRGYIIIS